MSRRNTDGSRPKVKAEKQAQNANKKLKAKGNVYQMPEKLPEGEILNVTNVTKKQWRLGRSIGVGGFGEIYSASDDISRPVPENAEYVIKIEPHENGPLFTETHFYLRAGKAEQIEKWRTENKLTFLGMPKMSGFGSHMYLDVKYRFMVMDRYGVDLQRIFETNKKKFSLKSVYSIAIKLMDVLEYIHSTGYVHADIKASNLLLGYRNHDEIYLVDYGLACKYRSDDGHKIYEEDPRRAHDGTIEFTSRDAHVGAHSRRGDLEILAYNIVQWLCGRLPWEDYLKDPARVHQEKNKFMKNISTSLEQCFGDETPAEAVETYIKYVSKLTFEQEPNYNYCRKIFSGGLKKIGAKDDGHLDLKYNFPVIRKSKSRTENNNVANDVSPPKKSRNQVAAKSSSEQQNTAVKPVQKVKTKSAEKLSGSKKLSKSCDLIASSILAPGEVPTPAMLMIIQKREQQLLSKSERNSKTTKAGTSKANNNSRKGNATASKAPLYDDDSTSDEYLTPPSTRRLRSGIRRTSSSLHLNNNNNSGASPELF